AKFRYMLGGRPTVPLVIRGPQGGGIRLAAQHSQSLEAWFAHVPGLVVVAPATPYDAKGLLVSAIRDDNPVIFLEHKALNATKGAVPSARSTASTRRSSGSPRAMCRCPTTTRSSARPSRPSRTSPPRSADCSRTWGAPRRSRGAPRYSARLRKWGAPTWPPNPPGKTSLIQALCYSAQASHCGP